jgi:hypothetical protein
MTILSVVSAIGLFADRPAFGIGGRKYFATDTRQEWYDTGSAWVNITPSGDPVAILDTPTLTEAGPFVVPHGLTPPPSRITILPTSGGNIWALNPDIDSTNINLFASDAGISAKIYAYA